MKEVVSWLRERVGQRGLVGIHGESMGAVTALLYAGAHPDDGADFYIADCPFASFDEQLAYRLKMEYRLRRGRFFPSLTCFYGGETATAHAMCHRSQSLDAYLSRCCLFTVKTMIISPLKRASFFMKRKTDRNRYISRKPESMPCLIRKTVKVTAMP